MTHDNGCSPIDPSDLAGLDDARKVDLLRTLYRIRLSEEKVADLVRDGEIVCPCHLYVGQEAVAAGVCAHLRPDDFVFSTHRSHGHYLAKGGDLRAMMAELYGRSTGCSRGRGGSMHLVAPEVGFPGSSAIVAGTIPLAVGAALAFQSRREARVAVAFFGDGATNEGGFYESLNFAALKKLPVVFVCENNFYSTHMPIAEVQAEPELFRKAGSFSMPGERVEGNNVGRVYRASAAAVDRARRGGGPTLLECLTYRWRGHVGPNWDVDKGLRSQEEIDVWIGRCAIQRLEEHLLRSGTLAEAERDAVVASVRAEVEDAVVFARESPLPDPAEVAEGVFATPDPFGVDAAICARSGAFARTR